MRSINKKRFIGPMLILISAVFWFLWISDPFTKAGLISGLMFAVIVGPGVGLTGYYWVDVIVNGIRPWFNRDGWK